MIWSWWPSGSWWPHRPVLASRIAFDPALPPGHQHLLLRMVPGAAIRVITTYAEPFWREDGLCGEWANPRSPLVITIDQCPIDGTPGVLSGTTFGRRRCASLACTLPDAGPSGWASW